MANDAVHEQRTTSTKTDLIPTKKKKKIQQYRKIYFVCFEPRCCRWPCCHKMLIMCYIIKTAKIYCKDGKYNLNAAQMTFVIFNTLVPPVDGGA